MIHEIVKDTNKPMWNVITLAGIEGGIYYMGNVKGASVRPYNLVLRRKDEGMFESIEEIHCFLQEQPHD